jgi:hypothetical protein
MLLATDSKELKMTEIGTAGKKFDVRLPVA